MGEYYLESKNWKAALSRFESALVLAPDEPNVYWGLAEADRHLGNFADARANYQKVLDYDPDGPHGKAGTQGAQRPGDCQRQVGCSTCAGRPGLNNSFLRFGWRLKHYS